MSANTATNITAEELAKRYARPIFGFALKRAGNRQEAEDLAQEIMLQLFKSVAAGALIANMDAYVWTVARYVWANWVKHASIRRQYADINGITDLPADQTEQPLDLFLQSESVQALRREIALLSEMQRRIVTMHYYDGLKQSEIAAALNLPVGTVKWHLHDAKKEMKKGMEKVRRTGELSFNPIRFSMTGHMGSPGWLAESPDFLGRTFTQNLIYAMYNKPLSVKELANELGTPSAFIEDEIAFLAEYDFITETSPGKFAANIVIWEPSAEQMEERHKLLQRCAARIADCLYEALMGIREPLAQTNIYYPRNDYNFLLWTLLPKAIVDQGNRSLPSICDPENVLPLRKDGGKYIAYAEVMKSNLPDVRFEQKYYRALGPMNRGGEGHLHLWQLDTYWSDRPGWQQLHSRDVWLCDAFWRDELKDTEANREHYAFLLSKQYILPAEKGYLFNAVWIDSPETAAEIHRLVPDLSDIYKPAVSSLYEEWLRLAMVNQPKRLEPQIAYMARANVTGSALIPYVLKHLLDNGKLREPLPEQRKTITTLMGHFRK